MTKYNLIKNMFTTPPRTERAKLYNNNEHLKNSFTINIKYH